VYWPGATVIVRPLREGEGAIAEACGADVHPSRQTKLALEETNPFWRTGAGKGWTRTE